MLGEDGVSAVVAGNGNLVLDHVLFERNDFGRAVTWSGGSAKIVSSRFVTSGGFIFNADTTSMVNSALFVNGSVGRVPASQAPTNRIMQAVLPSVMTNPPGLIPQTSDPQPPTRDSVM